MRVGTAADIAPQLVPSLVAYRVDQASSSTSASVFASPVISAATETDSTLKAREAAVSDLIRRRPAPAGSHSVQYALPDPLPQTRLNWTWTDLTSNPRVLCGQAALQLPDDAPYRVFAPFVRGNFNTDASVTPQHVVDAVVHLVRHAMNHVLGVPGLRFPNHSIAFVVGDNWSHVETSSIYQAMFTQLEFASAFSHQESVLSCFGAGISSALVVDFGAEKTSVCCVDDGLTLPKSRAQLDFGGDDITEHLMWTLKRLDQSKGASGHSKSPFHLLPPELASLNVKRAQDFSVVDALKRDLCFVRDLSVMDPLPVYSYDLCMCHRPDPSTRQYPPPSTYSFDVSGAVALAAAVLFQVCVLY
jgi:actin-related protein 8